jgi:hypothetical protein
MPSLVSAARFASTSRTAGSLPAHAHGVHLQLLEGRAGPLQHIWSSSEPMPPVSVACCRSSMQLMLGTHPAGEGVSLQHP